MALTSAQIITLCLQVAKVPGFTSQAGQLLNSILSDLAMKYDLDVMRTSTVLAVGNGTASYSLPADYLRARVGEVFYSVSGQPTVLQQVPIEEYDALYQGQGSSTYPTIFATDMAQSPPLMYFYPLPETAVSITVRYQKKHTDIPAPETSAVVPWFPDQEYLRTRLSADLMELSDDARRGEFDAKAVVLLRQYLEMADDKEGYAQQVKLDGRTFRNPGRLKATKSLPL